MKRMLAALCILVAAWGPANAVNWSAISGGMNGLSQGIDEWAYQQEQRNLLELQHQQEMARMLYQHQLQMQVAEAEARRRAEAEAAERKKVIKAADDSRKLELQRSNQILDVLHPGWRLLINTDDFQRWMNAMPPVEKQAFASSLDPYQVSTVLHRYKDGVAQLQAAQSKAAKLRRSK